MEAVILCGGKATRLRPYTEEIPKALIPIKGVPILKRQIEQLLEAGVNKIILATGFLDKQIVDYIMTIRNHAFTVVFSKESEPLGSAGAVRQAMHHITGNFLVLNGDILSDMDFKELIKNGTNSITLTRFRCPYGVVKTNGNDVIGFDEKPMLQNVWVSAGYYYLDKRLELPTKGSLEYDVFPNLALKTYKHKGYWQPIDTQKDIDIAEKSDWIE